MRSTPKNIYRTLLAIGICAIGLTLSVNAQDEATTELFQPDKVPSIKRQEATTQSIQSSFPDQPGETTRQPHHSLETSQSSETTAPTQSELTTSQTTITTQVTPSDPTSSSEKSETLPLPKREMTEEIPAKDEKSEGGFFGFSFDIQVIPDIEQVHQALINSQKLPALKPIFESNDVFDWTHQDRYLNINHITLYQLDPLMPYQDVRAWFQNHFSGILVANVSITNTSDQEISMPENSIQFYINEQAQAYQSIDRFFPLESGTLNQVVSQVKGKIQPEQTIEGYVIYVFTQEDFQELKQQGYAVMAYQSDPDSLNDQQDVAKKEKASNTSINVSGSRQVIPLSFRHQKAIIQNQAMIDDKVGKLWLANKTLLAKEDNFSQQTIQPLSLQVKRLELSELDVHQDRVSILSLDHLPDKSLLLSVEFDIMNQQSKAIWIQPNELSLRIHGDQDIPEKQEAMSTNMYRLDPNEKVTMVHSLLISREIFQTCLQDHVWQMELNIPTFVNAVSKSDQNRDFAQEEIKEQTTESLMEPVSLMPGPNYGFFIDWQPEVEQIMDDNLQWRDRDYPY